MEFVKHYNAILVKNEIEFVYNDERERANFGSTFAELTIMYPAVRDFSNCP